MKRLFIATAAAFVSIAIYANAMLSPTNISNPANPISALLLDEIVNSDTESDDGKLTKSHRYELRKVYIYDIRPISAKHSTYYIYDYQDKKLYTQKGCYTYVVHDKSITELKFNIETQKYVIGC